MNKGNKLILLSFVLYSVFSPELILAQSQPTITPVSPVYALVGEEASLMAEGGSCLPPDTACDCPPWTYDPERPFTYQWSDAASTSGATFPIPTTTNTGSTPLSLTVLGLDQGWKDTAGADGGTTSTPESATVTVHVITVKTDPVNFSTVRDGAEFKFEIKVDPVSAKNKVTDIAVTMTPSVTGPYYNPQNTVSTVVQDGADMFKWKTPSAHWYTTTDGGCGTIIALYTYEIKFKLNGVDKQLNRLLVVDASGGDIFSNASLRGSAWPNMPYSGTPLFTTTQSGGVYKVVASTGTGSSVVRALSADHSIDVLPNSHFKNMVESEEAEHEKQLEDNSTYAANFCTIQSLIDKINQKGYSASTAQAALNLATADYPTLKLTHFNDQVAANFGMVNGSYVANRIAMERAAKIVANASYVCAYKCTSYPQP